MNLRDVTEIRMRAKALHDWLQRLDPLTNLYRDPKLTLADTLEIDLPAGDREAVKLRAGELAGRLLLLADSLVVPTGAPGGPDLDQVAGVEREPVLVLSALEQLITRQLNPLLDMLQEDQGGGVFGHEFEPADAQGIADAVVTISAQVNIYVAVLVARLEALPDTNPASDGGSPA